jgi:KipI family sensor histidine kinase inhibitor
MPLGDRAVLVRFDSVLSEAANLSAISFARLVHDARLPGVEEIAPQLVSVMLRYDPLCTSFADLCGGLRLLLGRFSPENAVAERWTIPVGFNGPDLAEVADALGLTPGQFIAAHNAKPLRVLTTGFAPGFVYCGMHDAQLVVPRRKELRQLVRAGSVLFAAGQTAIAATDMPTGWHVIGNTRFANFRPDDFENPTLLTPGDEILFEVAP